VDEVAEPRTHGGAGARPLERRRPDWRTAACALDFGLSHGSEVLPKRRAWPAKNSGDAGPPADLRNVVVVFELDGTGRAVREDDPLAGLMRRSRRRAIQPEASSSAVRPQSSHHSKRASFHLVTLELPGARPFCPAQNQASGLTTELCLPRLVSSPGPGGGAIDGRRAFSRNPGRRARPTSLLPFLRASG